MKKNILVLLLALALCTCLTLCVGAEDGTGVFGSNLSTFTFVSLVVAGIVLVVIAVVCIVKREALAEALRAYRSEMKKITWFSWKNVVRCTVFVIVAVVAIGVVVGLLDIVFFEAQHLASGTGSSFFGG